jgi:uncharacterized spore protein YtfJ
MIDTTSDALSLVHTREDQLSKVLEKVYAAAQPEAVFGEPVRAGNYTVITASEVTAGGGFGWGFGPVIQAQKKQTDEERSQPQAQQAGGGGIGGGGSSGRPVAIIIIESDKVTVQPVVDVTKIALAGLAAWGTIVTIIRRMRKAGKR